MIIRHLLHASGVGSRQLCCREPTPRPSPSLEGKELIISLGYRY
ncbi:MULTISPECIES: hypothetical protein [unclassified Okeania]|nr:MULTISPECIES: hypothetical protein [unclassified Okeania]